jgi:hypothetical protein
MLNCEEKWFGGIRIYSFLELYSWIHVDVLRRGDQWCVFWGNLFVHFPMMFDGGDRLG